MNDLHATRTLVTPNGKKEWTVSSYTSARMDSYIADGHKHGLAFDYDSEIQRAGITALLIENYGSLPGLDLRIESEPDKWSEPKLNKDHNTMTYAERQSYVRAARQPIGRVKVTIERFY
jgi:hypothetical protein